MRVIKPSYAIEDFDPDTIMQIERAGRTAYKSEDKITPISGEKFVRMVINRGHESVLEHKSISVRFIHNRGFTHELVRNRIAAYTQESTRYCVYSMEKFGSELTVIEPYWYMDKGEEMKELWYLQMMSARNDSFAQGFPKVVPGVEKQKYIDKLTKEMNELVNKIPPSLRDLVHKA